MVRTMALTLLGAALWAPAVPAGAQTGHGTSAAAIARGDELHAVMRPGEALMIFEEVLFDAPRSYELLWRAARESAVLGMLATDDRTRKGRFLGLPPGEQGILRNFLGVLLGTRNYVCAQQ